MRTFRVLLEWSDDGWWVVTVPELPGCISQGRTKPEALENIREAIACHLEATSELPASGVHGRGVEEAHVSVDV